MSSNWASTYPPYHTAPNTTHHTDHDILTSAKLSQVLPYHHHPFRYDASSFPTQAHPSSPVPADKPQGPVKEGTVPRLSSWPWFLILGTIWTPPWLTLLFGDFHISGPCSILHVVCVCPLVTTGAYGLWITCGWSPVLWTSSMLPWSPSRHSLNPERP